MAAEGPMAAAAIFLSELAQKLLSAQRLKS